MVNANLADALANLTPHAARRGPRCSVADILDQLDPAVRAALEAAMAREGITSAAIAETLSAHGYPVKGNTVARHRRAGTATGCLCPGVQG